jgi:hypothetical protein
MAYRTDSVKARRTSLDARRRLHEAGLSLVVDAGLGVVAPLTLGLCLPGSLVERTTRCGSPRCRCHTDPSYLHGPYPTWIRKAGTRTITRTLSPAQLERYRPLFDNTKRLRELISELETLSAQAVEHAEGWAAP